MLLVNPYAIKAHEREITRCVEGAGQGSFLPASFGKKSHPDLSRCFPGAVGIADRVLAEEASSQARSQKLIELTYLRTMFNEAEKTELRRIVNKFVEQGLCVRPVHPDQVMREVTQFKLTDDSLDEVESGEAVPRFQM